MMRGRHKQGALPTNGMRSMWEFVFVAQFLRVFQGKFGFVNFTAEELENAFLESKSSVLLAIFCDLLRILLPKRDIKISTWQEVLKEEFENRSSNWRPFEEGKRYETFSAEERVLLLKHLIDYLTDGEDKELKEFATDFLNPNSTKVKPVGHDANNNIYWYFDDRRLYREIIGKKGHRTGWETVCLNYQDWNKLLSTFQKSTNSNEKRLYKYLKNELFPAVMPSAKEDEKEKELVTLNKDRLPKVQDQTTSKHKTEKYAVVTQVDDKVGKKRSKQSEASPNGSTEEEELEEEDLEEEDEEDTAEEEEEDHDLDDNSEADEEFDPEDEEDSPPPKKKRKPPPALPQVGQRKRGRPAGSSRTGALDQQKAGEKKRKRSTQNQEQIEKDMQERKELELRVEEEIQKQESIMHAAGVESRTKRRCVIMREKMNKKKEWWEEEGLGSESEEDNERDIDSDGSDGPRRRRKVKVAKPVEMPEPPNRIYVFSTILANRAAEAMQMGRVESITAFHRAQPSSSSPFLKLEQSNSVNFFGKQKPYYPQQYPMRGSVGAMGQMSSFSGMSGGMHMSDRAPNARSEYGTSHWEQMPAQQPMYKERQRQAQSQAMDDIHQLLFGGSQSGSNQAGAGMNGIYSRGGYNQQGGVAGEQSSSPYPGYPGGGASQHQASYVDRRTNATQQAPFPSFSQQQHQQQGYFQRPRHLGTHPPQGNCNSPSADPVGAGVRSPPPPYPGNRPSDSRHTKNSPVPSPTSTGSPHTPQTPLTPQTPRFPGPSPSEPSKPPFSPSHPQGSMSGPTMASYNVQTAQTGQPMVQGDERNLSSQARPGFIELSSKTLSHGMQNPYSSVMGSYNQAQSPLDGRRPEDNKSPAFGTQSNQESPLQSPADHTPPSHYGSSAPPNKSPFVRPVGQASHNHSPFATSGSAVQASKSFSVESLTAPSQPPLDKSSIPPTQLSEQPMPQYSGLYFPSNKYPPMFGQPQYQYPSHMQHPGAFYNSQLTPNMYLGRASLPVYPPNRDPGL